MAELPPLPEGFELVPQAQPQATPEGIPPPPPGYVLVPPKPQQESSTWLGRRLQDVGAVYDTAFPDRDPKHASTPGFTGEGLSLDDTTSVQRTKMSAAGFEDPAWKKRVLEIIGPNRFLELKKDAKDNDIVRYRGDDGKEYEAYLNRPGIDTQDIDRTISGSVPYALAALPVGRLTRAFGLGGRTVGQGLAAGGVSIGQDIGAGQEVDLGKAGTAATFGAAGEVAGWLIPKVWRTFFTPRYWDESAGALTEAGRKEAQKLGLEPDQVTAEVGRRLSEIRRAPDPRAAAAGVETDELGIPTTRGQRTNDPEQLHVEEQMRRSLFGPAAREVISEFDTQQTQAIERAAGNVRQRVAPQSADDIAGAGQGVAEGLTTARQAADQRIDEAWDAVTELNPVLSQGAQGAKSREALTTQLRTAFDDLGFFPDEELTPQAHRMMLDLTEYSRQAPERLPYEILGDARPRAPALDAQRRRLLKHYQNATTPQDRAAARTIYDAFNDWTETLAQGQLVRNTKGQITSRTAMQPFQEARRVTREQRALFEPKDARGKLLPEGRILSQIAEGGDTPERIGQTLFGAGTAQVPKAGTVKTIERLREVLDPAQFDQVKALYVLKMFTGKNGEILSPRMLDQSVKKAMFNQKSVVEALFSPEERQFIERFRRAVETASYVPPNPSGTSYALESFRQKRRESPVKFLLRRMGTRATFQGNTFEGGMWGWLARALPNVGGMQEFSARNLARKAIRQNVPMKPDTGELMAAIVAAHGAREEGNR